MTGPEKAKRRPTWDSQDAERTEDALRRAWAAVTGGRDEEAWALLDELIRSPDRSLTLRGLLLAARRPDLKLDSLRETTVEEAIESFDLSTLSPWLSIELAGTFRAIGRPERAAEEYRALLDRVENQTPRNDRRATHAAALAHYRLGEIAMDLGEPAGAYAHWRRAYEAREISEVFPYAAYALARRIGTRFLLPERIQLMYMHAVRSNHLPLEMRARLDLAEFLASREQFASAREHLAFVQAHGEERYEAMATDLLWRLALDELSAPDACAFADGAELRPDATRILLEATRSTSIGAERVEKVIIVGAGTGGRYLLEALEKTADSPIVLGFIDDDPNKLPPRPYSMLGDIAKLREVIEREGATEVLMAIPTAPGDRRHAVVQACRAARIPLRNLPCMHELIMGWETDRPTLVNQLRAVKIVETIGDEPVTIDDDTVKWAQGLRALVIGATGLGAELCRRLALSAVESLTVLDPSDHALASLIRELADQRGLSHALPILGETLDSELLIREFRAHKPDVVFHTAGLVESSLLDRNAYPTVRREVVGARTVAEACGEAEIPHLVYVSDLRAELAADPFGAIKALAEEAVLSQRDRYPETSYAAVRTAPPMGLSGSIVCEIEAMLNAGSAVTIPGPGVMGRFTSAARTAELLLHVSRLMAEHGISGRLALNAGTTESLERIAAEMIHLSGRVPNRDIPIRLRRSVAGDHAIEPRGEPLAEQREILQMHRRAYGSGVIKRLIERLESMPGETDQARTLQVLTLDLALTMPDFENPPSADRLSQR